ncbi:YesN/AraC family two-component response regulator [Gracilibacillus halotolerans]|uniref:YesN/AraC family two-component response regulator n=1 Tax=Gracilibacillus halotolerans TaxID=74386 RepID=A0A841RP15_9BACI|nr:response regulator [Gracilibacillus halotolerans]MBB6513353.1 YesN/AraC family two-component response regulator [Gracilibacillus halotolerans]
MYQILIVDDEPNIAKGIKHLINYAGMDVSKTFAVHSGQEALDVLQEEEIDLLITDIQMDGMTGLELMHQAKILYPWMETIVISAYQDFKYAQTAIQLGAKDYLIKPIQPEHIINTIRNCLMNHKEKANDVFDTSKLAAGSDMQVYPIAVLDTLIKKSQNNTQDSCHIPYGDEIIEFYGPYFAFLQVATSSTQSEQRMDEITRIGISVMAEEDSITFFIGERIYLLVEWSNEAFRNQSYSKLDYLGMIARTWQYKVKEALDLDIYISYSQILKGINYIEELKQQTDQAIELFEVDEINGIYYYGDYNWSIYQQNLTKQDYENAQNHLIKQVRAYIQENFKKHGLTLGEIAEANHVSSNYLSHLFKQETGNNIWDYVVKLRMEEGKYLWLHTDKKAYEIADYVGYETPEHFSKVFKKYYGQSLQEMKKKHKSSNSSSDQ